MYFLFDIGGTKIRLAGSNGKTIRQIKIISTPKSQKDGLFLIKKMALKLAKGKKIKAAAGGIAGVFDKSQSRLVASPNLSGWVKRPLKEELEKILKASVYLENDAALAALGEAVRGAGRDYKIVAYLTVSTGLGGARIVNGKIEAKSWGFEPGHQIIASRQPFSYLNYLDGQISGSAILHRYGKVPPLIKNKKIWQEVTKFLVYGLHNVIVLWSPDIIVLGGGIMTNKNLKIEKIKKYLKKTITRYPELPTIKKSQLKEKSALYGALEFLRQKIRYY